MNKKQATKGGEYGANGEFYKGGAFINTVAENPKGSTKSKKATRKQEVAPYVWEVAPEGMMSVYGQLAGFELPIWENGKLVGFVFNKNLCGMYATAEAIARREMLIAKYTQGERWV